MFTVDPDLRQVVDKRMLPVGVTSADLNRDQSLLALGFNDGRIMVLDLKNAKVKSVEFTELKSAVTDVCWNIGGDYLAASDTSGELMVWQWYERKVRGTGKNVVSMGGGKKLLTWSYDGKKLYWSTRTQVHELIMETGEERVVAKDGWVLNPTWSHEGKLLAWIGPNNTIAVLDSESGKTIHFRGHQLFIETLYWHPSKHYLMSSSADGSIRIWNVDDKKEIRQILGHGGPVYTASWNSDGSKVISGGLKEDQLHAWDVSSLGSAGIDRELKDHPAFAWHPDGIQIAVAEGADILIQDDSGKSRQLDCNESGGAEIFGVAFDPTGDRIACVSLKGRVWTIDAKNGDPLKVFDKGGDLDLYPEITGKSVAWSPDGKFLAGIGPGGKVKIWNEAGEDVAQNIRGEFGKSLILKWNHATGDDDPILAVAGTSDYVLVINPVTRKIVKRLAQYGWTKGLAWSPDGTRIAASERRSIRIWDTETETQTGICEGPSAMIRDISWSSSQGRIAAFAEDGLIGLWNTDTLSYCGKFRLHQRTPYSIRWSADGKRLVSTARHGRIVFQAIADPEK